MSSPNRAEYSDARGYSNEFHVKELYRGELAELLGAHFRHTRWFSQRNAFVSMIVPEVSEPHGPAIAASAEVLTISKAKPDARAAALPALYFLVVTTNDSATLDQLAPRISVFGDTEEWAYGDYRQIYQASKRLLQREAELEKRCAELEQQIATLHQPVSTAPATVLSTSPVPENASWLTQILKRFSK